MSFRSSGLAAAVLLAGAMECASAQKVVSAEGCVLIRQKCKLQIRQTKFGFEFGGLDFTSGPVSKVGSVKLSTELIQKLTEVSQILDYMQLSRCQQLNTVRTCDPVREKLLIVQAIGTEQLGQLALLAQMYSGNAEKLSDALLKWIVQSTTLVDKVYEKQFMAADPKIAEDQKKALGALEFAIGKLGIAEKPEALNEILQGPAHGLLK